MEKIYFLEKYCKIIMNKSINIKGGTCILIKRSLNCKIERIEMSADSRITSAICNLQNKKIHLHKLEITFMQLGRNSLIKSCPTICVIIHQILLWEEILMPY